MTESPPLLLFAAGILSAFFIGSCPTGYLITKALRGMDIREYGSGNPGAANVFRVVGKIPGAATLLIDLLKGLVPVLTALHFYPEHNLFASFVGIAAITGHNWTPFLSFKGGKGVATSIGVFLALTPVPAAVALGCFMITLAATRTVSLSSLLGAVGLCLGTFVFTPSAYLKGLSIFCTAMIVLLHKKNIGRLIKGQEPKISFRNTNAENSAQ